MIPYFPQRLRWPWMRRFRVAVDLSNRIVTIGETDLSDLAVERCACLALQLGQNGAFPVRTG
jgi:hypothetical protein